MLPEFKSIFDLLKAFPTEQSCIDHLEGLRWEGIVVSPFDESSKVYKCAGNKYKCKNTGKYFNVRTNTIFDNTKIPLQKWFLALYVFSSHKKGISSHQLAKDISVTQKSAWFMLHRLRYAFDHPNFKKTVGDIVEIDESGIGGDSSNKHESKKTKNEEGNTISTKTTVLGFRERGGNVIAKVVSDRTKDTLLPIIHETVEPNSVIMTDDYSGYNDLSNHFQHHTVNHSAKQYVNEMAHTNGIENFWSHLKRGIDGIYHSISNQHLQAYVDEFTLRFNTRKLDTQSRFDFVLSGVANRRLTYKNLIK
ncbi:ISXO2 transposase-like protein [Lacibacter cauensis]|uniref:ISXO2 transposase-like protein n=1 Tax=Lacibacter cauensis TaxID=510947 RepID=A0A562SR61_9BACT|nr:IS1595 family transposase [Lacibacter cauensis]TWI83296.1 ISXO2 transposase-like protein [Lacibacter cauensis]